MLVMQPTPTDDDPTRSVMTAPRGLRDAARLQAVDIDALNQFWVTVRVPQDAAPGTYTAPLRVRPANGSPVEVTLEVEVYPFELLPPMMEYSIYYPVTLVEEGGPTGAPASGPTRRGSRRRSTWSNWKT